MTTLAGSLGAGIGGLLLGGVLTYLILRYRPKAEHDMFDEFMQRPSVGSLQGLTFGDVGSGSSYLYQPVPSMDGPTPNSDLGQRYHVEPFVLPSEDSRSTPTPRVSTDIPPSPGPRSKPDPQAGSSSRPVHSTTQHSNQVYVVHHDGGGPPVTLYTSGAAEIVELPPGYPGPARRHTRRSSSLGIEEVTELPSARRGQLVSSPGKSGTSFGGPEWYASR